jgi:hypothetical protein
MPHNGIEHAFKCSSAPLAILLDACEDKARVKLQYGHDTEEFNLPSKFVLDKLAFSVGGLKERGGVFFIDGGDGARMLLAEFREQDGGWQVVLGRCFRHNLVIVEDATAAYNELEDALAEALRLKANKLKRLHYWLKKSDPLPDEGTGYAG